MISNLRTQLKRLKQEIFNRKEDLRMYEYQVNREMKLLHTAEVRYSVAANKLAALVVDQRSKA